jgi:hypothetical protein
MALDFITGAEELATKVLGFFKTPEDALAGTKALYDFQSKIQEIETSKYLADIELLKAQAATNTVEAGSSNLFVSGWRSFCGWAAGITVFGGIWLGLILLAFGRDIAMAATILLGTPFTILMGMLGLHSYERKQGVAPDQSPSGVPTPSPKK